MKNKEYTFIIKDREGFIVFVNKFLKENVKCPKIYNVEEVMNFLVEEIEEDFNIYDNLADSKENADFGFTDLVAGRFPVVEFSDIEKYIILEEKANH